MAEAAPFLGIISFGLTICKDLYAYYHAYKGFDSKINSAFESIVDVTSTLLLLKDSCEGPGFDQERRERVATCVHQCDDGLNKLSEKLQQLRIQDPDGFRQKSKALFKRSAFPFRKESLDGLQSSAIEVQRRLALALQALDIAEKLKSQRVLDCLENWSRSVTVTVDQTSIDTQWLLSIARSDDIDKIKSWLSPPDPWTNHHIARSYHQAGTGEWVLDNAAYKAWLGGSTRHLWLYGKAGCGKTILSSTIVEDVQRHCRQAVDFGFAPFYFTFSDKGKQSYEALLRSLLAQFGTQEPGLAIMREGHDRRQKFHGRLSVPDLQSMFIAVLAVYNTAFVVLDALDECPEDSNTFLERSKLFDGIEYLSNEAANLKIFMTSRDVPDFRDYMAGLPAERLPVVTSAVNKDIHNYVVQQLTKPPYFTRLKPKSLDLIKDRITAKADGMFRWAYCQLFELSQSKLTKPSHVKNLVEALPTTLDGTYTRMLERIRRLGPAVSEDALTLLRWLAYAARPITLAELQAAVTIRPEDGDVDFEDEGDFRDSLEILAGLVVSSDKAISDDTTSDHEVSGRETSDDEMSDDELWEDEVSDDEMSDDEMSDDEMLDDAMSDYAKSNDSVLDEKGSDDLWPLGDEMLGAGAVTPNTYIRLAHFSVKEYLESIRISESSASFFRLEAGAGHKFLAQSCLTYLMSYSKSGDKTSPKLDMNKFRLLDYAAQYWYKHSKLQSGNDVGLEVALLTCDAARIDWIDAHGNWTYHQHFCNHSGDSSVYFAAMLRLKHVAEVLLIAGEDVNAVELGHIAPIIGATENDDQDMVKLLLAHGADINVNPSQKEHPLYLAARSGYSLLKLLIDNGADVNLPCFYGTALSIACVKGHRWVVEYLLERGAQVNNVDCDYWEVLAEVSRRCDKTLMDPLTTRDTNGKRPIRSSKPLLRAAALLDHAEIIPMLINAGVDINVEDNGALSDALMYGSENAVAMLESSGANKLTLEQLSRALVQVCCVEDNHKNQDRAVELLLGRGADVDAEDSSALSAALEYGHEHIVTLLETKGAKKLTLEHLNELLIRACENGYKGNPGTAVELLLDRGAEINAEDSSALFGALRHGYRGLVALLEAKGAEKLTQEQLTDALTRVPKNLGCCAYRKAVKMLVNRGADATAVDLSGI